MSDFVKNAAVKKAVYEKLAAKVNNIDTSEFVLKTKYQTGKTKLEKKIPDATDFVKKTKLTELEDKIRDVSSLATKTALTTVENKIPSVSNLVKKTDYNTKVTEIENKLNNHNHDKYITTPEFNTLAANVFNARLAQANSITKTDFDAKLSSLDSKIVANKSKNESIENQLKQGVVDSILLTVGTAYFDGKGGSQAYLIFQPVHSYLKIITNTRHIAEWKSKGLSNESFKSCTMSNDSLTPLIDYYGYKIRLKFNGSCLRQPKLTYTHEKAVNIYIV